jgi:hypothetical protein
MDTSRCLDTSSNIGMDTRYYLGSDNMNSDMDNMFCLDSYNNRMDHTPGPQRCLDSRRVCIHYPKPNREDARPVLDRLIVLSKLVLLAPTLAIAMTRQVLYSSYIT